VTNEIELRREETAEDFPSLPFAAARFFWLGSVRSSQGQTRMKFDTTSLGNAVRRLRQGPARCEREPADEQIRDGLIHRFEFTYELSHKMLGRYLKETSASPDDIERMPFADLVRTANTQGLLRGDWPVWRRFMKCAPARAVLTMPTSLHGSLRRSRRFWMKPSTSTPNCSGGLHDPISAYHLDGRAQAIGAEYSSCEFATKHKGMGVWLAGDRPGKALFRSRSGDRCRPATDARRIAELAEAFSDSDLPYKVDLADWRNIDGRWQQTIMAERVALTEAAQTVTRK
jgi:Nucleotidyltransferase substrate binding protein like